MCSKYSITHKESVIAKIVFWVKMGKKRPYIRWFYYWWDGILIANY